VNSASFAETCVLELPIQFDARLAAAIQERQSPFSAEGCGQSRISHESAGNPPGN